MFTSLKDGDLDIYTMNIDGSNVQTPDDHARLRRRRRSSRPTASRSSIAPGIRPTPRSTNYRDLLAQRLVRPNRMEIWVMNADGSNQHQITNLGGANFAPYFTPDGKRIIFSSNYKNPHSRNFDLYLVNPDGTRPRAGDAPPRVRRLSDVQSRRQEARLGGQSRRERR